MIHIKETEIIPFLKTAQTGYTKMISEGDLEMEVELAKKGRGSTHAGDGHHI